MQVKIRPAGADDLAFIFSTFLKSAYYGTPFFSAIERDSFFTRYSKVVEGLAQASEVRVACLEDDESIILGYCIAKPPVLHYVYVRDAWRKQGIAKKLTEGDFTHVTHITKVGNSIRIKKGLKFDPFLI